MKHALLSLCQHAVHVEVIGSRVGMRWSVVPAIGSRMLLVVLGHAMPRHKWLKSASVRDWLLHDFLDNCWAITIGEAILRSGAFRPADMTKFLSE